MANYTSDLLTFKTLFVQRFDDFEEKKAEQLSTPREWELRTIFYNEHLSYMMFAFHRGEEEKITLHVTLPKEVRFEANQEIVRFAREEALRRGFSVAPLSENLPKGAREAALEGDAGAMNLLLENAKKGVRSRDLGGPDDLLQDAYRVTSLKGTYNEPSTFKDVLVGRRNYKRPKKQSADIDWEMLPEENGFSGNALVALMDVAGLTDTERELLEAKYRNPDSSWPQVAKDHHIVCKPKPADAPEDYTPVVREGVLYRMTVSIREKMAKAAAEFGDPEDPLTLAILRQSAAKPEKDPSER